MVLLANQIVTFKYTELDTKTGNTTEWRVSSPVHIWQEQQLATLEQPAAIRYRWAVIFDPALRYPNDEPIGNGHLIEFPFLMNGEGTLERPILSWGPFTVAKAYINETGG